MKPLPRNGEVIITIKNGYVEKWEPVRHGRWIETGVLYRDTRGLFYGKRCSACNELSDCKPHYCPNCGARMEAE